MFRYNNFSDYRFKLLINLDNLEIDYQKYYFLRNLIDLFHIY